MVHRENNSLNKLMQKVNFFNIALAVLYLSCFVVLTGIYYIIGLYGVLIVGITFFPQIGLSLLYIVVLFLIRKFWKKVSWKKGLLVLISIWSLIYMPLIIAAYGWGHTRERVEQFYMIRVMPPLVTAIETYKKNTGTYPAELETLIPDYIPHLPKVIFDSNRPPRYELGNAGYLLYFELSGQVYCYRSDEGAPKLLAKDPKVKEWSYCWWFGDAL